MRKYKVMVIALQLANQDIAKYPDIVSESQLSGNADELEKAGFVQEVQEEVQEVQEEIDLLAKKTKKK